MAAELARIGRESASDSDPITPRLWAAVDLEALVAVGWDPVARVFAPPPDHPLLGFVECAVHGCDAVAVQTGLCGPCSARQHGAPSRGMTREQFIAVPRVRVDRGRKRDELCLVCRVPGFERPASGPHGLCLLCAKTFRRSGVASIEEVDRRRPAVPGTPNPARAGPAAAELWPL